MGVFNRISLAVEETCQVCNEPSYKCNGCQVRVDLGNVIIYASGVSKEVIRVTSKGPLMSVGSTFLSAIRVGIVLLMMCVGAYAFDTEASYYTVASCLREGTSGICANGEKLDDNKLTCASWDYKFGTILKVTNKSNGKYIYVRVNDRGPNKKLYRGGRKIDLSKKAYKSISSIKSGVCQVSVEFVK